MIIRKCTTNDTDRLAVLNKQLIEDEKSDNKMSMPELRDRMRLFLETDYDAYFFMEGSDVVGYALVRKNAEPIYLRQFLIEREFRRRHFGKTALGLLLSELETDTLDLEVLTRNEAGRRFWESCGFTERSRYLRLSK